MPGLKEVRIRIASVKSTQQITSAMKMVSASKLKRAQNAIVKMRPYSGKLKEILENLCSNQANVESVYSKEKKINKILIIAITSNRGLCGAFNANVVKTVVNQIHSKYIDLFKNGNVDIICIGKKGADFLVKRKYNVIETHTQIFDSLTFENASPIAEFVMKVFAQGKYDRVDVVYNQFKNAGVQILTTEQFLPIVQSKPTKDKARLLPDYIFEPGKAQIISELIPKSLKIQFYKILLDSFASEHGARMTAMHKATDNADNLLKELKLSYNKARQASITKEILEIVGGAEALKG
jgi:F-type H+-transporting ATPase subunit gamma